MQNINDHTKTRRQRQRELQENENNHSVRDLKHKKISFTSSARQQREMNKFNVLTRT